MFDVKKYIIILLFFLLSFLVIKQESYAYIDCNNYVIESREVNTLNLDVYLNNIYYRELISFCSYDKCYDVKEGLIKDSINNFKSIYDQKIDKDELEIVKVKGYPITKIVINNCK